MAPPMAARAQLYISPIVRHSVTFDKGAAPSSPKEGRVISGKSTRHGKFMMADNGPQAKKKAVQKATAKKYAVMRYGKNVPLFVAMENLVPNASSWAIHFDKGVSDKPVSWHGGKNWRGVLKDIGAQNHLSIVVNDAQKAIGVSSSAYLAKYLAHPVSEVWRVRPNESMVANIKRWAGRAGLTVDKKQLGIDYPTGHAALFTGTFREALNDFLGAYSHAKTPPMAKIYRGNGVVRLMKGGYHSEAN